MYIYLGPNKGTIAPEMLDESINEPVSPPIKPELDNTLPPWLMLPPRVDNLGDGVALIQHAHASGENKYERLMPAIEDYPPGWPGPKPEDKEMGLLPMNLVSCEWRTLASRSFNFHCLLDFKSCEYQGHRDAVGSLPNPSKYAVNMDPTSHMQAPARPVAPRERKISFNTRRRDWDAMQKARKKAQREAEKARRAEEMAQRIAEDMRKADEDAERKERERDAEDYDYEEGMDCGD